MTSASSTLPAEDTPSTSGTAAGTLVTLPLIQKGYYQAPAHPYFLPDDSPETVNAEDGYQPPLLDSDQETVVQDVNTSGSTSPAQMPTAQMSFQDWDELLKNDLALSPDPEQSPVSLPCSSHPSWGTSTRDSIIDAYLVEHPPRLGYRKCKLIRYDLL